MVAGHDGSCVRKRHRDHKQSSDSRIFRHRDLQRTETVNSRQRRLWERMINTIDDYKKHAIGFSGMVGALEGGLDAGEFADRELNDAFYEHWRNLETVRSAAADDTIRYADVSDVVDAMEQFLKQELSRHRSE